MAATAEEEAIIKKRYLTQTTMTQANLVPPFTKLTKRCASWPPPPRPEPALPHSAARS